MELVLRVNLVPLDGLNGLINEVFASDPDRSYLTASFFETGAMTAPTKS